VEYVRAGIDTSGVLRAGDPESIGAYRLVRRLGAGGMGTVFLALDRHGQPVALKVLHHHLRDDPLFRYRFGEEFMAARRVASFATARVLDADLHAPLPYLVTEYVPGMSLYDRVTGHGPLPGPDAEALAVGVATALTAIHAARVVHRDLKPSNVMLSPVGPKVIDFGIAGAAGGPGRGGVTFGTPGWLAPEQRDGHAGGPPADVFAWGLLVAWAATGRHPFGGERTRSAPLRRPSPRPAPGPRRPGPDLTGLPPRLVLPVRAALAADPADRPSAQDLLLRLCGTAAPAPEPPTVPRRRVRGRPPPTLHDPSVRARRRGGGGLPLAVLAIALVLVGSWLAIGRNASTGGTATPATAPSAPGGARDGGAGGGGAAPPATSPAPSPTPPARAKVRDGGLEFAITGLRCGVAELGEWPTRRQPKGRFCLLDLRVTNIAKHDALVFMNSQHLVDGAGHEYPADEWAWVYHPAARVFTSTFKPGRTVTGTLVFDVPAGTRVKRLIVHDTPLSAGTSVALG
jgi:hypothetical protein